MTGFDEKLRSELGRAAHAAAPDQGDVLADVTRRRARRDVVRKIQLSALSVVVVTASVAGVVALRSRFAGDTEVPAATTAFGATGLVTTCGVESIPGSHLCTIPVDALARGAGPEDLVLITDEPNDTVMNPAASPDGTRVVFDRAKVRGTKFELWIANIDGTGMRQLLDGSTAGYGGHEAAWSPDGRRLVYVASSSPGIIRFLTLDSSDGPVATGPEISREGLVIAGGGLAWSPDGSRIAFSARPTDGSRPEDIYTVRVDGSTLTNVTKATEFGGRGPTWSRDGTSIAYWQGTPNGSVVSMVDLVSGRDRVLVEGTVSDPTFSPDGRWIAFVNSDPTRTDVDVIPAGGGDPVRIASGVWDMSWIPAVPPSPTPPVSTVSPEPTGDPSAGPVTEGGEIGLDVNVCQAQAADGLALLPGNGLDTAWTGFLVDDTGRCPRNNERQRWIVAVDVTGDRQADAYSDLPLVNCPYVGCWPLGATDLDADGDGELIVTTGFSIRDQGYFSIATTGTGFAIGPILVAEPGHPAAGIQPGEPLTTSTDGDAGYAAWMRCEDYPSSPIVVFTYVNGIVESDQPVEWHEIKLQLRDDGMFHVIDATDLSLPPGDDPGFIRSHEPACGIAFSQIT